MEHDGGSRRLARHPAALDFVTDAFAHCKFIGYIQGAMPLLEKTKLAEMIDDGFVVLDGAGAMQGFVDQCRKLRFWERESKLM